MYLDDRKCFILRCVKLTVLLSDGKGDSLHTNCDRTVHKTVDHLTDT